VLSPSPPLLLQPSSILVVEKAMEVPWCITHSLYLFLWAPEFMLYEGVCLCGSFSF
jgi:hypothetical protein